MKSATAQRSVWHAAAALVRSGHVLVDGSLASTIESSGTTKGFEAYALTALQASTVVLQAAGMEDNGWLSTLEASFVFGSDWWWTYRMWT